MYVKHLITPLDEYEGSKPLYSSLDILYQGINEFTDSDDNSAQLANKNEREKDVGLSKGAIAGIVLGIATFSVLLALVTMKLYYILKRRASRSAIDVDMLAAYPYEKRGTLVSKNSNRQFDESMRKTGYSYPFYNNNNEKYFYGDHKIESTIHNVKPDYLAKGLDNPFIRLSSKENKLSTFRPKVCVSILIKPSMDKARFEHNPLDYQTRLQYPQYPQNLHTNHTTLEIFDERYIKKLAMPNNIEGYPSNSQKSSSNKINLFCRLNGEKKQKSVDSIQWVYFTNEATNAYYYDSVRPLDIKNLPKYQHCY